MKKMVCLLTAVMFVLISVGCAFNTLMVPTGYYSEDEHWDPVPTQDSTDFCKYLYMNSTPIKQNHSYRQVTENDIPIIREYVDDFRGWMKTCERLDEFDFYMDLVNSGDYFAIESKYPDEPFWNYNVYIFDVETNMLYFMHSNI